MSAFRLSVVASSSFTEPPVARICPLGSIVAFISMRACDIGTPYDHAGLATERSIISVVAVAGLPPPKIMTRGLKPLAGVKGIRTELPYVRVPLYCVFAIFNVHV